MPNAATQPTVATSRLFVFYQHELVLPQSQPNVTAHAPKQPFIPFSIDQLTHVIRHHNADKNADADNQQTASELTFDKLTVKVTDGYYACQLTDAIAQHWLDTGDIDDAKRRYSSQSYRELIANVEPSAQALLARAIGIQRWRLDHQFCSRCSTPTHAHPSGEPASICPSCGYRQYPRIQPCVITAIHRLHPVSQQPQILLAHHHRYGSAKVANPMYGLIAGFVEVGETLEQAVQREVFEETGLQIDNICYHASQYWPYPSNLMLGFFAQYVSGELVIAKDELSDARFFDLDALPTIPPKGSIAHELIGVLKHRLN